VIAISGAVVAGAIWVGALAITASPEPGVAAGLAATGSERLEGAGSGTAPTSASVGQVPPTPYPKDSDGVPTEIGGEPVLRGAAITARLAGGDTSAFLAAGWLTVRRDWIWSLVEAHTDHPATDLALMGPATSAWGEPPDTPWPGGFVVLRVRPTCQMWPKSCLVVIDTVRAPTGGVPGPGPTPGAYDEAGIPREIDGQPVLRGTAIADRVASGSPVPFVVAVWFDHVSADRAGPNGGIIGCDFARLLDGARGDPGDGPELRDVGGAMWFGGSAGPQGAEWPGYFTVLRVRAGCPGDRPPAVCLTVLAAVLPPVGLATSPTPLPLPSLPPVVWRGDLPTVVGGEQLLSVRDVGLNIASLRAAPKKTLLVAGYVKPAAAGCTASACPKSKATTLVEPRDLEAAAFGSAAPSGALASYQLLRADGSPWRATKSAAWPKGLYVLRIRAWLGRCRWSGSCRTAFVVVQAVPPK